MFSNEAFARTAERYMDTIYRVAYGWLKNPDDANDVTQDVLIELYKTEKAFESDAHLKNWLIRATVNRCKMLFRSPWRRLENIDDYTEMLGFEHERDQEHRKSGRRTAVIALAAALLLATGSAAYAADLGSIQRRVQLWLHGDQTDAVMTVEPGHYTLEYTDENGETQQRGGGGVAFEPDGTERPLTPEELMEHLNAPEVSYEDDGSVWIYYYGEKLDITHQFDDDGVCYVQLTNGEETVYLTVKYQNGYAMSSQKYLSPHEFN